jgi:hypothetical protein
MKLLHCSDIDITKYTACVSGQAVSLLYAQPWYLDAVTNRNWWCVIEDNYQWVLPFGSFRKWAGLGSAVAANPLLVQQSGPWGVYTLADVDAAMSLIASRFSHGQISLSQSFYESFGSKFSLPLRFKISLRVNQQVFLPSDSSAVVSCLNDTRRKHFRRGSKVNFTISLNAHDCANSFLRLKGLKALGLKAKHVPVIKELVSVLSSHNLLSTHFYWVDDAPQLCLLLADWGEGVISLLGGPVNNGASLYLQDVAILAEMKRLVVAGKTVFDFEGSNLPGVAAYNRSFGAVSFAYPQISW